MDGFHDLGGRQGFGPVLKEGKTEPFHDSWEVKISAINGRLVGRHAYNMDEYRHAIERMAPRHYVGASYFERAFTAVATLCIEKGYITHADLNAVAGEDITLARPSMRGRMASDHLPELKIGDRVMVKNEYVGGHIRMPAYIRGKVGEIVSISPEYPFPDAAAHGLSSPKQRTYDVRFQSQDLWSNGAEKAEVHLGVFHSYLQKID